MTRQSDVADVGATGGVIFRDDAGDYYAIPRRDLAQFRVADDSRPVVEAFLSGEDAPNYTVAAATTTDGDQTGSEPKSPAWTVRTSRRSNDLWLISA